MASLLFRSSIPRLPPAYCCCISLAQPLLPTFPSGIDERREHFRGCRGRERGEGALTRGRQRWRWRWRIIEATRRTPSRRPREGKGRERDASWPERCFPRVSMSIYLPGAYSDKSVIAAEASKRVARRHHHPTTTTTITTTTTTIPLPPSPPAAQAPLLLTPPFAGRLPLPFAIKHAALCATNTLRFLSRERDIILKSAVDAAAERQRRTAAQTAREKWRTRERERLNVMSADREERKGGV